MSDKIPLSFVMLPTELVYRILDHLSNVNIFWSMQNVCRRFDAILKTYYRYKVNIFKCSFS